MSTTAGIRKNSQPSSGRRRSEVVESLAGLGKKVEGGPNQLTSQEWLELDVAFHEDLARHFVVHMRRRSRVLIGLVWLPVVGIMSLLTLLWIYPHAERAPADGATVSVHWWGPDFGLTETTSVLLLMAMAAVMGSVVQAGIVFAIRKGKRTLEQSYDGWYYLRPIVSLLLGPLFGLAVFAGLVVLTDDAGTTSLSLPAMVSMGALAGLFTDRVLQQMQRVLGATDPDVAPGTQGTPWTPNARNARQEEPPAPGPGLNASLPGGSPNGQPESSKNKKRRRKK